MFEGLSFLGDEGFGYLTCYSKNGEAIELIDDLSYVPSLVEIEDCNNLITSKNEPFQSHIFNIYPNPSNDVFFIENKNSNKFNISIFNLLGQKILQFNLVDKTISIENLSPGTYIINIEVDGNVYSQKLIKT